MQRGPVLVAVVVVTSTVLAASCRRSPETRSSTAPQAPGTASDIRLPDAVAGWTARGAAVVYDPTSIYTYIDGQAEVYRAYGMTRCVSRRFAGPSGEADLVADVFELASPEDAYGVFTHDRDGDPAGIGNDSLYRYGWLSFWTGRYFVSIVAEGDSDRSRAAVKDLGRAVAASLPAGGQPPAIVAALPAGDLDPRSVRFLRHAQILNTHAFVSDENVFELAPDTAAALGTYRRGQAKAFLLRIDYPDAARAAAAADNARQKLFGGARGDTPVAVGDRGYFALDVHGRRLDAVLGATTAAFAKEVMAALGG
jgi:Family of unknown function (DUF6599)